MWLFGNHCSTLSSPIYLWPSLLLFLGLVAFAVRLYAPKIARLFVCGAFFHFLHSVIFITRRKSCSFCFTNDVHVDVDLYGVDAMNVDASGVLYSIDAPAAPENLSEDTTTTYGSRRHSMESDDATATTQMDSFTPPNTTDESDIGSPLCASKNFVHFSPIGLNDGALANKLDDDFTMIYRKQRKRSPKKKPRKVAAAAVKSSGSVVDLDLMPRKLSSCSDVSSTSSTYSGDGKSNMPPPPFPQVSKNPVNDVSTKTPLPVTTSPIDNTFQNTRSSALTRSLLADRTDATDKSLYSPFNTGFSIQILPPTCQTDVQTCQTLTDIRKLHRLNMERTYQLRMNYSQAALQSSSKSMEISSMRRRDSEGFSLFDGRMSLLFGKSPN